MFLRLSKCYLPFIMERTLTRSRLLPNFQSTNQNFRYSTLSKLKFYNDINKKEFYVIVDGCRAFVEYHEKENVLKLIHTTVPDSLGGRGVAKFLAKETFEYVAENNLKMEVHCDFLESYLEKHGQQYKKYLV